MFDKKFLNENMMGPNAVVIMRELARGIGLRHGMRVLDLGCGKGLTSMWLAKTFGVTVFAADLWIPATENWRRFQAAGLDGSIVPIHAEAHELPFADEYFDAAVSVDAYHYFGAEEGFLEQYFAPLVKRGGKLAIAVPGLEKDFEADVPEALRPHWQPGMETFHSAIWWRGLWERTGVARVTESKNMDSHEEAWRDWLACGNEHAAEDVPFFEAGRGYLATVGMVAEKI